MPIKEQKQLHGFEPGWGYSQTTRVGDDLFISGTVAIDDAGAALAVDDMAEQVRIVYEDLKKCLALHGATLSNVIRESLVTTDMERFLADGMPVRAAAYEGHSLPSAAPFIEVPRLANPAFLFEVELHARL